MYMKKIVGMLVGAGVLLALMNVSAIAYPVVELGQDAAVCEKAGFQKLERIRQHLSVAEGKPTADVLQNYIKVRGVWGYAGDNESDGYFGGNITRRNRVGLFRGLYNITDNESKGRIVGIMRYGYFNGRVITPDGDKCHVTALYKIDEENELLKLRWMTPLKAGWAVAKIEFPN
jgi:hypothetical protein